MKIRRKSKHAAEVPTHSLNDIMFFLLLFFLIIATFINANGIKLITAKSTTKPDKENPKKYELEISVERECYYNGTVMRDEELLKVLTTEAQANPDMLLAIDCDMDVDIQKTVDVLSICKKANAKYYLKDPREKR